MSASKITYSNKNKDILDGVRNLYRDSDANEVKDVVNNHADLLDILAAETGNTPPLSEVLPVGNDAGGSSIENLGTSTNPNGAAKVQQVADALSDSIDYTDTEISAVNLAKEDKNQKNATNGYAGLLLGLIALSQLQNLINDSGVSDTDKTWSNSKITAALNALAEGLQSKPAVKGATFSSLPSWTQSGTYQILTATVNGAFPATDGVTYSLNEDILVKDETDQKANGIFKLTQVGSVSTPWILTRRADANTGAELRDAIVIADSGTVNGGLSGEGTSWRQTSSSITIGTDNIIWVQYGVGTPDATTTLKGKLKLLNALGSATDGAINQNIVSQEFARLVNSYDTLAGTNSYTASPGIAFLPTAQGIFRRVKATNTSTGLCTLNYSGLGAQTWYKNLTTQAGAGDIVAGQHYIVSYDTSLGGWLTIAGTSFAELTDLALKLAIANNLSDLNDIAVARQNLGMYTGWSTLPSGTNAVKAGFRIVENCNTYLCLTTHTKGGTFNSDYIAGYWQLVGEGKKFVTSNISGAVSVDASTGNFFVLTLTGNVTSFTVTNALKGHTYVFRFVRLSGTSYTIAGWNSSSGIIFETQFATRPILYAPTAYVSGTNTVVTGSILTASSKTFRRNNTAGWVNTVTPVASTYWDEVDLVDVVMGTMMTNTVMMLSWSNNNLTNTNQGW